MKLMVRRGGDGGETGGRRGERTDCRGLEIFVSIYEDNSVSLKCLYYGKTGIGLGRCYFHWRSSLTTFLDIFVLIYLDNYVSLKCLYLM